MNRKLKLTAAASIVALAVGLGAIFWPSSQPKPSAPVVNCAGDHDGDCPAGEPDRDR